MQSTPSERRSAVRILHAFKVYRPDVVGGIPEVITCLATGVGADRQSSILVARKRGFGRRLEVDGIPVEAVTSFGDLFSLPIAPTFPFRLAQRARDADLVAFHAPFPLNDIGATLGLPDHVALVVHWHGEIVGRSALASLANPFVRRSLARAQRIVVSDPVLVPSSPFLAPHAQKCVAVPFGVDLDYWGSLDDTQRAKVEALRTKYPRLVVATGRLVPYKGFDILVRALRKVDATAVIVGDGPVHGQLVGLAQELGVNDRLILAGRLSRDNLKVHLHAARAFVFPSVSISEAFGIAQLEAMAAGRPVVNTNLPTGVPKVARHECEALTVPPSDPDALARAIGRILIDEPFAQRLGTAARMRAEEEYDLARFVRRVDAVYDEAIAEARAGSGG